MKDIIILVIASQSDIYDKIVKNYWNPMIEYCHQHYPRIQIYLLYGNSYQEKLNVNPKNLLKYDFDENFIPGILKKTIMAFEYVKKNYQYQTVIRTNISSFLVLDKIIQLCDELSNNEYLYAGHSYKVNKNKHWISGALFLINENTLNFILDNLKFLSYKTIDDVAIGRLLMRNDKIKMLHLPRCLYFNNLKDNKEIAQGVVLAINQNQFHFRIKSRNRKKDILTFEILTKFFYPLS